MSGLPDMVFPCVVIGQAQSRGFPGGAIAGPPSKLGLPNFDIRDAHVGQARHGWFETRFALLTMRANEGFQANLQPINKAA